MRDMLFTLQKIYETLWQCTSDGFVAKQLSHRYNKMTQRALKKEWEEQTKKLLLDVGASTIEIAELTANLSLFEPAAYERLALGVMLAEGEKNDYKRTDAMVSSCAVGPRV